jgi:hypothetical protein
MTKPAWDYGFAGRKSSSVFEPDKMLEGETKAMSANKGNDENIPTCTDDYYEKLASQEEEDLDETEEDLRAWLTFDDPSPSGSLASRDSCGDGERFQDDIRIIQTSDGPENEMFSASSTSPFRGDCRGKFSTDRRRGHRGAALSEWSRSI